MALSRNFEIQMGRRETPGCYKKYKAVVDQEGGKKKCGMCWFSHHCKAGKEDPNKKKLIPKKDNR